MLISDSHLIVRQRHHVRIRAAREEDGDGVGGGGYDRPPTWHAGQRIVSQPQQHVRGKRDQPWFSGMKGERLQPDGGAAPGGRPVGLVVRWAVSHQHPDEHDHRHRHSGRTPKPARLFHDDDRDDDTTNKRYIQ